MVGAAAESPDRDRLPVVLRRFVAAVLDHLGEHGQAMWSSPEAGLWAFHLDLLAHTRGLVRAVVTGDAGIERRAAELADVAYRYQATVARGYGGPSDQPASISGTSSLISTPVRQARPRVEPRKADSHAGCAG